MKTPEEIKKGLECALCDEPADLCGEDCPCWSAYSPAEMRQDEHVSDALHYIQQLESRVPRWIPVEERLPEEGKNVLIFVKCMNNWWHIEVDWRIGGCWFNNAETDWNKITHWMEMPEPPEEGEE